jgi:hypothetical protein
VRVFATTNGEEVVSVARIADQGDGPEGGQDLPAADAEGEA